jgi:hypothetical protein
MWVSLTAEGDISLAEEEVASAVHQFQFETFTSFDPLDFGREKDPFKFRSARLPIYEGPPH